MATGVSSAALRLLGVQAELYLGKRASTEEVRREVIRGEVQRHSGCESYLDVLRLRQDAGNTVGPPLVGEPTVYVSHAWT